MTKTEHRTAAAGNTPRRLYVYNGGFLTQNRVRRILSLAGYDVKIGKPADDDRVGVWGHSPTSGRGEAVANRTNSPILRVEDTFLRSVLTGRDGDPAIGLHLDTKGVHFDPSAPSDLETLLAEHPLDDTALLNRAKAAIKRIQSVHLSKYNAFDPLAPVPKAGYVLVIDQTRGDASVKASGADSNTFKEMLYYAQEEHPSARIIVKTHPESSAGHRQGYFAKDIENGNITLWDQPVSPWALFDGATAVYTVSSQMGFEAILSGHKPVVFGQPFYAGWGLSDDRKPLDRRQRKLTRAQLFAAAMILYPHWYDPHRDALCDLETAIDSLEAQAKAWRDDHAGWTAHGMRLWKRKPLQQVFGRYHTVQFANDKKPLTDARPHMVWASKVTADLAAAGAVRVEDGFIRSKGLGANLITPMSLVLDDLGIYYDPRSPSRLEQFISEAAQMSEPELDRARRLKDRLIQAGVSKYNLGQTAEIMLPKGRRILVPGQVEDDASIRTGTDDVTTNLDLLKETRRANPAAIIIYKPHPDVEAGLRSGMIDHTEAKTYADVIADSADPIALIDKVYEVWTMTSLLGFEALIRGKAVTCFGSPFYAHWGLTDDRALPVTRRNARPSIDALCHAVLIDYPRYFDPKTGLACPAEVVLDRLETGDIPKAGRVNRLVAKLQGVFASYAYLWR